MRTALHLHLPLVMVLGLALPNTALAQAPWNRGGPSIASSEGYSRGVRAGEEDARRNQSYNARDEADYRRADAGYRPQYGSLGRYRDEFRRAFETGYADGYRRYGYGGNARDGYGLPGGGWNDGRYGGRGQGPGYGNVRTDIAFRAGVNEGYEAGLDDGRDGRPFDPVAERKYRNGDSGYDRRYGPKDAWKIRYREGFTRGYEEGFQDGRLYDRRYDGRDDRDRRPNRPWWWPFE